MTSTTIPIGKFRPSIQQWQNWSDQSKSSKSVQSLKLLNYNVWFADEFVEKRTKALFSIFQESDADFIALQEVTYHFLHSILMQQWVKDNYYISDINGSTFSGYGVVLLSKHPIHNLSLVELPTEMERNLLLAEVLVNNQTVGIATVHLESMRHSAPVRLEQLEVIFPLLEKYDLSVLMGDFNFCSSNLEQNQHLDKSYIDAWAQIHGNKPGYTIDTQKNRMLFNSINTHKQKRIDRILACPRNSAWKIKDIRILGDSPISKDSPHIFPSDHFGLMATLKVN